MRKLSHPYIIRYLGCGVLPDADTKQKYIAVVRPSPVLL